MAIQKRCNMHSIVYETPGDPEGQLKFKNNPSEVFISGDGFVSVSKRNEYFTMNHNQTRRIAEQLLKWCDAEDKATHHVQQRR